LSLTVLFLAAFALSLGLTPAVRALALRLGVVDRPGARKMHQVPVPLLGGASLVLAFVATGLAALWAFGDLLGDEAERLPALLAAASAVSLLGAYDDWKGVRPLVKFLYQVVAAGILVASGVQAQLFTNPLGESVELGWLGVPLTVFWIVGVTNAINLIDGLDGLAAGVGAIASLALCAVGASTGEPLVAILALLLAGTCLGFLPFNAYPARVFLGDTGSMFLGFVLASLGVVGSLKATTATLLILPIVVLGVPVFDTLWAILRRTRMRVSPFRADRDHIHHRLVRVGLHHRHVVFVLYFVCVFLGVSAWVIVQLPYQMGLVFAVLLAVGGIIGVWTLKFVEDHLEERLLAVSNGSSKGRSTPPPEVAPSFWQASNGGRNGEAAGFQVSVCEVGRFRDGLSGSASFGDMAEEVREALGRRLKVYAVTAHMQEDRNLLLVLKTERIDGSGLDLVREGLTRYFAEAADRWGEGGDFPAFRWVRPETVRTKERRRFHPQAAL
jgi:UDP-GlcNAc:undecaprenyl-phosphate GlcNAc-1-phosphate transferase